jgi:hypothetical protein
VIFFLSAPGFCFADLDFFDFGIHYQQDQIQGNMDVALKGHPEAVWGTRALDYTALLFGAYMTFDFRYFQTTLEFGYGPRGEGIEHEVSEFYYTPNSNWNIGAVALLKLPFNFFKDGFLEMAPLGGIRYNFLHDYKAVYPVAGLGLYIGWLHVEALYSPLRLGGKPDTGAVLGPFFSSFDGAPMQGVFDGDRRGLTVRVGLSWTFNSWWSEEYRMGNTSYGNYSGTIYLRRGKR